MTSRWLEPWTVADDDRLTEYYEGGWGVARIAAHLQRTVSSVENRASFLGLRRQLQIIDDPTADLYQRLLWSGRANPNAYMTSPAWVADLTAWHDLGRPKLPDTPDAA